MRSLYRVGRFQGVRPVQSSRWPGPNWRLLARVIVRAGSVGRHLEIACHNRGMLAAGDFHWDEYCWVSRFALADSRLASGPVPLVFAPEGRLDEPLNEEEIALVSAAAEDLDNVVSIAVSGILDVYPAIRQSQTGLPWTTAESAPAVASADKLLDLVEVSSVNVHRIADSVEPYVGVEFDCSWDPEHGAGALMNGKRVVEVGLGDTAILLWIAEQDLAEQQRLRSSDVKRRWWKRGRR